MSFRRYILSFFGNKLIELVLKVNLDEFTTSYRGFNLKTLKDLETHCGEEYENLRMDHMGHEVLENPPSLRKVHH